MENPGLYLWLWLIVAPAVAFVAMSGIGGNSSAMGARDLRRASPTDPVFRDPSARL